MFYTDPDTGKRWSDATVHTDPDTGTRWSSDYPHGVPTATMAVHARPDNDTGGMCTMPDPDPACHPDAFHAGPCVPPSGWLGWKQ